MVVLFKSFKVVIYPSYCYLLHAFIFCYSVCQETLEIIYRKQEKGKEVIMVIFEERLFSNSTFF